MHGLRTYRKFYIACTVLMLGYLLPVVSWGQSNPRVDVGLFSIGDLSGWETLEFSGTTEYVLIPVDGKQVIEADSQQSASALYKKIKIDLNKTPILNWAWRKEQSIDPGAELDKAGDDYVARIYVVKNGGLFWWKTMALNYVWSYQHKRNDIWNNPFGGKNTRMLAQRDASNPENVWFKERRNVAMDFVQLYGIEVQKIDGVAIMTDSDNSGLSARALYGDIFFSAK